MTPIDALVLITVLTLPPIACKMGYRRGAADERERLQRAHQIRLRSCKCDMQSGK